MSSYNSVIEKYFKVVGHYEVNNVDRLLFLLELIGKEVAPWYPDGSGDWVEIEPGRTHTWLPLDQNIQILMKSERDSKVYSPFVVKPRYWDFQKKEVVAYKVEE